MSIIEKVLEDNFLTPRRKNILRMRLRGLSLEQIGLEMGLTRQRIQQLSVSIREKIKENLSSNELREYVREVEIIKQKNKSV